MWTVRRGIWDLLSVVKFKANRCRRAPAPTGEGRRIVSIPLSKRYPGIPITSIHVADHVPKDESSPCGLLFCKLQAVLYRHYPPASAELPEIDPDPRQAVAKAYSGLHRRYLPDPVMPREYAEPVDLGHIAVTGPYACYLQACDGGYEWDFLFMNKYEHHEGLLPLWCRVYFTLDAATRKLSAVEIESDLGLSRPGDATWNEAQRVALCAATNHLSIVRHFSWIHLVAVSSIATSTRNMLPADHAVRRLLWPHVWGTQYSNELVTDILLMKGGDFEAAFSLTHPGLCGLLDDSCEQYDLRVMHPTADAERRGVRVDDLDLPYLQNRQAHYDVFLRHTSRYLRLYYETDEELQGDRHVQAWLKDVTQRIPGGLRDVVGEIITVDGLARLIAGFIYVGSVEHDVLGTTLWNYQLWYHVQPTRIYTSGRRESVDVYQRLLNYNFILNVRRSSLCADFTNVALDAPGRTAFRQFLTDLEVLQGTLDHEEEELWKVSPKMLESGVNG